MVTVAVAPGLTLAGETVHPLTGAVQVRLIVAESPLTAAVARVTVALEPAITFWVAGGTINNFQTVVNSSAISEWGTGGMPFELTFPYTLTPTNAAIAVLGTCRVWAGLSEPSSPGAGWAAISGDLTQPSQPTDCSSTAQGDYVTALAAAPSSASTIYAVTDNQQAWVTTDAR